MAPRVPIERRVNEETGVEEARCRRTCQLWKPLDQFAPSIIRNNLYYCKDCKRLEKMEYRHSIANTANDAHTIIRKIRARERKRGVQVHLCVKDVQKILAATAGQCCITKSTLNVTLARLDQTKPLGPTNVALVDKFLERGLYNGNQQLQEKLVAAMCS